MPESRTHHDRLRVLTIRGRSPCNNHCVFCVEHGDAMHPARAPFAEIIRQIDEGAGRFDMLSLASGEPTLEPRLFEILGHARSRGYEHLAISSNFRRFVYPLFAAQVLHAGVRYFDLSLHAFDRESQQRLNPIGDEGRSFDQAMSGLKSLISTARNSRVSIELTHKIVVSALNVHQLVEVLDGTRRLGVRNYILQPVRLENFPSKAAQALAVDDGTIELALNHLIDAARERGVSVKPFGFGAGRFAVNDTVLPEENEITNRSVGREDFVQRPGRT